MSGDTWLGGPTLRIGLVVRSQKQNISIFCWAIPIRASKTGIGQDVVVVPMFCGVPCTPLAGSLNEAGRLIGNIFRN